MSLILAGKTLFISSLKLCYSLLDPQQPAHYLTQSKPQVIVLMVSEPRVERQSLIDYNSLAGLAWWIECRPTD